MPRVRCPARPPGDDAADSRRLGWLRSLGASSVAAGIISRRPPGQTVGTRGVTWPAGGPAEGGRAPLRPAFRAQNLVAGAPDRGRDDAEAFRSRVRYCL